MDLFAVAKLLAPLAPVAASIAGGLVGGPAGAAAAGGLAKIIMGKFGVDANAPNATAQLSDRIAEAGEETARAKINAAMEQARAEITGFVEVEKSANELMAKSVAQTNETMRAEADNRAKLALAGIKEHWFFTAWRPVAGWEFNVMMGLFGLLLAWAMAKEIAVSDAPLKVLTDAWPLFASYIGALALVNGILIPSRSFEKKAAIENAAPMPNAKPAAPVIVAPAPPVPKIAAPPPKPATAPIGKPPGSRD